MSPSGSTLIASDVCPWPLAMMTDPGDRERNESSKYTVQLILGSSLQIDANKKFCDTPNKGTY